MSHTISAASNNLRQEQIRNMDMLSIAGESEVSKRMHSFFLLFSYHFLGRTEVTLALLPKESRDVFEVAEGVFGDRGSHVNVGTVGSFYPVVSLLLVLSYSRSCSARTERLTGYALTSIMKPQYSEGSIEEPLSSGSTKSTINLHN